MAESVRIGVTGHSGPAYHSHFATNVAIYEAATELNLPTEMKAHRRSQKNESTRVILSSCGQSGFLQQPTSAVSKKQCAAPPPGLKPIPEGPVGDIDNLFLDLILRDTLRF